MTLTTSKLETGLLETSAIVLAGGLASRVGQDKGFLQLCGKPLIEHVLCKVRNLVDQTIIVLSSESQADKYERFADDSTRIIIDRPKIRGPLAGAATGFSESTAKYSLLLPCDAPFVSSEILRLLLELCVRKNAAIPRWPNCYIEPLQAVYCTESACRAAEAALLHEERTLQSMVDELTSVRYVSTLVLEQLDPKLLTFFNVNTIMDLKKAETILRSR
jgi:molybdopterin-guanine dinucleotide biosynthesis protein A